MILDKRWAELADRSGAVSRFACGFENSRFVEVIAAEVRIDLAEHGIVFEERGDAARRACDRGGRPDRVAEIAGIAKLMAGRETGGIGGRERREYRMAVGKVGPGIP